MISKIKLFINCDPNTVPLTVTVDDPAGNSWIEYVPGEPTHKWAMYEYNRTAEQNVFLGLISADDVAQHRQAELANKKQATDSNISSNLNKEQSQSQSNQRRTFQSSYYWFQI